MNVPSLFRNANFEVIGKNYLAKALLFAYDYEFGKSYEYFKDGLKIITCDCATGSFFMDSKKNKEIFNDININYNPHHEYFFVKAYILSYEKDKQNLYSALDSIEKYIQFKNDEYGFYVKGKILLALKEKNEAYLCFKEASSYGQNQRLLFRMGQIEEYYDGKMNCLSNVYYSFIENPTSVCCIKHLKKYMKKRGISLPIDELQNNLLIQSFNNDESEHIFANLFKTTIDDISTDVNIENNISISFNVFQEFYLGIKKNHRLFVGHSKDNYWDDYDSKLENEYNNISYEDNTDWSNYNDNLDMDQQGIDFWNQF